MKKVFGRQSSVVSRWKICCLLSAVCCLLSCSIPNLEAPECINARIDVKEFYSYHFGNDMRPSAENLKLREKFLTKDLFKRLIAANETAEDYFTFTKAYPKAFRVGECKAISPEKTVFGVVLFWKDDVQSEQSEVKVEAVRENGEWLIDKVEKK